MRSTNEIKLESPIGGEVAKIHGDQDGVILTVGNLTLKTSNLEELKQLSRNLHLTAQFLENGPA